MTDQHFEVDILIRDAEGHTATAHGEYKTADADSGMVAKEVTEALKSRLGPKYRPINPDA